MYMKLMNNYIFTDIDGVLNPNWSKKWKKSCVDVYNTLCLDFDLKPVITSTWRIRYNKKELQEIFINQGINITIYDYVPVLQDDRGIEIDYWLRNNDWAKYVVIDDKIKDIVPYVNNIVKCTGHIGLTQEQYNDIKKLLSNF